jgi:hypothetical protein
MISRKRLLRKLRTVMPAVATHDLVPQWMGVLFTGQQLVAFNDRIGLSTPLHTSYRGCIPAVKLVNMLKTSRAATVELQPYGEEQVELKLGTARVQLWNAAHGYVRCDPDTNEVIGPAQVDGFLFEMPPAPTENLIDGVTEQFLRAVACCLQTVSEHAVKIDQLGVTLIPDGRQLKLFSTNLIAMTHCSVEMTGQLRRRVLLWHGFCREMLRLAKQAHTVRLAVGEDHALFLADDTLLFGRLIKSDKHKPLDFEGVLRRDMPNGARGKMVVIPKPELGQALQRATRICDISGNEVKSKIKVRDGVMQLASASNRGQALDSVRLPGHPDIDEVKVEAAYLLDVYPRAEKILLREHSVLMGNADALHVIAAY